MRKATYAVLLAVLVLSVAAALSLLPVVLEQRPETVSSSNATIALSLRMSLNTTLLSSGQGIDITVYELNMLGRFNNITAADAWNYTGYQGLICVPGDGLYNLPFNVAIVPGYYTQTNVSVADSLPVFWSPCTILPACLYAGGPPTEYDFYPQSSMAVAHNGTGFRVGVIRENVSTSLSFSGYYDPTCSGLQPYASTLNFPSRIYTVICGDEWGQLAILHFTVE
jgi:hypothetical protein